MRTFFWSNIEDGLKSSKTTTTSDNNNWKRIFGAFFFLKHTPPNTKNINTPEVMYAINYLLYPHKAIQWISSVILHSRIVTFQKSEYPENILTELITKVVEISNDSDPSPEVLSHLYPCLLKILNESTVQTYEDQMIRIIENFLSRRDVIPTLGLLEIVEMVAIHLGVKFNVYYSLITGLLFSRLKDSQVEEGVTLHILKTLSALVKLFKDDRTKIIISTIGSLTEKIKGLPFSHVFAIFEIWTTIIVRTVFYFPHRREELTTIMNTYYSILCKEALRYCSWHDEEEVEEEKDEEAPKHSKIMYSLDNKQTKPLDSGCQNKALSFLASLSNLPSIFVSIFRSVINALKRCLDDIEIFNNILSFLLR
eukprot:TRINITY_DN557_c0_g1_i3.p1 TRINITY_DN557_c0_g1~~TRINITY_DN557_c0_g1_i3.p1  ORF type:complete len:366 (-),score=36.27 TRINITY_DN557_c0_g1_i3:1108-2205(-)